VCRQPIVGTKPVLIPCRRQPSAARCIAAMDLIVFTAPKMRQRRISRNQLCALAKGA
jgi:hypothetical protein